jgi:1,4-dihydroxy-6-naphthoate synthase
MTTFATASSSRKSDCPQVLSVAYTPDSDDAFNFLAWEHGEVVMHGWAPHFVRGHIAELNRAAADETYDVVAVSSVAYPELADKYWILSVGSSVGRGYGPVLVARQPRAMSSLEGTRIAIPSLNTTGGMLARMFCPDEVRFIEMPYDRIAEAILRDEVDAGVMIHEELVHFPALGLQLVIDLGAAWTEENNLPLPVGLNIARKALGRSTAIEIARTCRHSLEWALAHPRRALTEVGQFGRGCAGTFVPMFSNSDTLCMPGDVRAGLRMLFNQLAARGWAPTVETIEVIDG